jgi:hypothetical protein
VIEAALRLEVGRISVHEIDALESSIPRHSIDLACRTTETRGSVKRLVSGQLARYCGEERAHRGHWSRASRKRTHAIDPLLAWRRWEPQSAK